EDPISSGEFLSLAKCSKFLQQTDGSHRAPQVVVLGRPEHAKSGDRSSEISIHGLLEQHDVGIREISCIADLIIEQLLGRVIVGQRWFYPAGKRGDAVTPFAHCSEEGVDAGHAARVATLETASFVQPLNPEDVGAVNRTMEEDHGLHAGMT